MKKYIGIIIIFSISIFCCSQNIEIANGAQLFNISGEIYNNPSCEIKAYLPLSLENEFVLQNCSIDNGKLFLSIPKIIKDEYLFYNSEELWYNMIKSAVFLIDFKDSIGNGSIFLGIKRDNEPSIDHTTIIYSDRKASISIPALWDGKLKTVNYKKGWNIIDWMFSKNYNDIQKLYDMGYKWYIIYYG